MKRKRGQLRPFRIMEEGKRESRCGEQGMIVVETLIGFTMFMIVTLTIVYLINIFTLHNRIQFAINSAAHEISSYSYLYQALGLRGAMQTIDKDGQPYVQSIDETTEQVVDSLNKMQGLMGEFGGTVSSVSELEFNSSSIADVRNQIDSLKNSASGTADSLKQSVDSLKELFSDPQSLMVGLIYLGASGLSYQAGNVAGTAAAEALTEKYLSQGFESADAYLRSYGITDGYDGLDFSGSTLFCDGDRRIIDIVVEYDVDLTFAKLFIKDAKLHVVQRVSAPAWLDGDGETVK